MLGSILDARDAGVDCMQLSWSLQANREDDCTLGNTDTQQKPSVAQERCQATGIRGRRGDSLLGSGKTSHTGALLPSR